MIGLFDSGIGGLTVLRSLQQLMPNENFIYLGDTARLPYGTKSSQTVRRYAQQNVDFLLSKGASLIVSACHSASSAILQESINCPVPLLNVIEPSCQEAITKSKNKNIGLLATQATVSSGQYHKLIPKIHAQAAPLLVSLVEAGWTNDPITNQIIDRYASSLKKAEIDTLILGCTHFPLLKDCIQKIVGEQVQLIDPGDSLAAEINNMDIKTAGDGGLKIYLTDNSAHFLKIAQAILMNFDLNVERVDL